MEARQATSDYTDAQAELGEAIEPITTKLTQLKTGALQWFIDTGLPFLTKNIPTIATILGGLTAAIIAQTAATKIKAAMDAAAASGTTILTVAQQGLNAAMKANPIGLIITGVTLLVSAFMLLWNNCEGFREFWIGLWDGIKSVVSSVIDWLKENWQTLILFLINPIAGVFKYIYDHCEGFREFIDDLWKKIKEVATKVWDGITNVITTAFDIVKNVWNAITGFFKTIWDAVSNTVKTVWNAILNVIQTVFNTVKTVWNAITGFFSGIWNAVSNTVSTVWNTILTVIKTVFNTVKTVWSAITDFFSGIWKSVSTTVSKVWNSISDVIETVFKNVKKVWNGITSFFSGIWSSIKDGASKAFNALYTVVSNVVTKVKKVWNGLTSFASGVVKGISNAWNTMVNALKSVVNTVISGINGAIGIINKIPGVSIGTIPKLAQGGVVNKATTAVIGEDGAEAVVPLEHNTAWIDKLADAIVNKTGGGGGVVVNQTNNYSQAHSRYEIYKSKQQTAAAVRLAMGRV